MVSTQGVHLWSTPCSLLKPATLLIAILFPIILKHSANCSPTRIISNSSSKIAFQSSAMPTSLSYSQEKRNDSIFHLLPSELYPSHSNSRNGTRKATKLKNKVKRTHKFSESESIPSLGARAKTTNKSSASVDIVPYETENPVFLPSRRYTASDKFVEDPIKIHTHSNKPQPSASSIFTTTTERKSRTNNNNIHLHRGQSYQAEIDSGNRHGKMSSSSEPKWSTKLNTISRKENRNNKTLASIPKHSPLSFHASPLISVGVSEESPPIIMPLPINSSAPWIGTGSENVENLLKYGYDYQQNRQDKKHHSVTFPSQNNEFYTYSPPDYYNKAANSFGMNSFNIMDLGEERPEETAEPNAEALQVKVKPKLPSGVMNMNAKPKTKTFTGTEQKPANVHRPKHVYEYEYTEENVETMNALKSNSNQRQIYMRDKESNVDELVTRRKQSDGPVNYQNLGAMNSGYALGNKRRPKSRNGEHFKPSSLDFFSTSRKTVRDNDIQPQVDSKKLNVHNYDFNEDLRAYGNSYDNVPPEEVQFLNLDVKNEGVVNTNEHNHDDNGESIGEKAHHHNNNEKFQQVNTSASHLPMTYSDTQGTGTSLHGFDGPPRPNPSEIAGLVIVQMHSKARPSETIALSPVPEMPNVHIPLKMDGFGAINHQIQDPHNNHNQQGYNNNLKVEEQSNNEVNYYEGKYTNNGISQSYNYATLPIHGADSYNSHVDAEDSYRNIKTHDGHEPHSSHSHHHSDEKEKEEMEFEEGKITITKTLLGSKYLKKGTVVVILAAVFVTLVLAGITAVGTHFNPILFPLFLLPIAIIAFVLFIPSILLFVPIVIAGLAGGQEKRRRGNFHSLFNPKISNWLFGAEEMQRNLDQVLESLSSSINKMTRDNDKH